MQSSTTRNVILLGFLLVFMLMQVFPLTGDLQVWRPCFVLLVVIYITHRRLTAYAVELACVIGLLLDIVYGGILGKHAIAFGLSIYLLRGFRTRLQHTGVFHEVVLTFLLAVLSQILLYSVNTLTMESVSGAWILYPAFTTALIWPMVSMMFDRMVIPPDV